MLRMTPVLGLLGLLFLLFLTIQAVGAADFKERTFSDRVGNDLVLPESPIIEGKGGQTFIGHLRIFVVERESRWQDASHRAFNFAFLDFAVDQSLSIPYPDTFTLTTTWDGNTVYYNDTDNFGDITEENIMVIAAVYDSVPHEALADPEHPFTAYYCDAAAAATPGSPGSNLVTGEYTHTVFIEEAATST